MRPWSVEDFLLGHLADHVDFVVDFLAGLVVDFVVSPDDDNRR
jgi:hypothetical protein